MSATPNYPFPGCCDHGPNVHGSKGCHISGCGCLPRKMLVPLPSTPSAPEMVEHLQADGWSLRHTVYTAASGDAMVRTTILRPDGTELDSTVWVP
jgi:hypothetical protein